MNRFHKRTNQTSASSLLAHSNTVIHAKINAFQTDQVTTMDNRRIQHIELEYPSEETLNLTNSWKELVTPVEYRTSIEVSKKYSTSRHHRAEIKRIEMALNQRRNRMIWNRMEQQNKKPEESQS